MREQFAQSVEEYSHLANAEASADGKGMRLSVAREVERLEERYAYKEGVQTTDEQMVYAIQKEKQELMAKLHQELRAIDDPQGKLETEAGAWQVRQQSEGRYIALAGGRQAEVTIGQLLTDGEWGIVHDLNSGTIPNHIKHRYVLENTKRKLRELLDEQIIAVEGKRPSTHLNLRRTYEVVAEDRAEGREPMGAIAEKMVRTYLEQLSWDYPDLGFTVERADVQQDIEEKIDFIIHRKTHSRGVNVEAVEGLKDAGIQFTTKSGEKFASDLAHKQEQIDRAKRYIHEVDDVVLVSIPLDKFTGAYNQWRGKRLPGGPSQFWDEHVKQEVFNNILAGILPPEEIQREWQEVAQPKKAA
jgi:hypothetical protein